MNDFGFSLPVSFEDKLSDFLRDGNGRFRDKYTGQVAEFWAADHETHVISLKYVGTATYIAITAGEFFSDWEATT